jgi:hypothetical protein
MIPTGSSNLLGGLVEPPTRYPLYRPYIPVLFCRRGFQEKEEEKPPEDDDGTVKAPDLVRRVPPCSTVGFPL